MSRALIDGDFARAAAIECSVDARAEAVLAQQAAARREPEFASRAFTSMVLELQKIGKFADAVALLAVEARIAAERADKLTRQRHGCWQSERDVLEECLVTVDRERSHVEIRETTRNELYDRFGIWIGSSLHVRRGLESQLKKHRKRKGGGAEALLPLERLLDEAERADAVMRNAARQILLCKLAEGPLRISLPGHVPHEDGCWISWRGVEAFYGSACPAQTRYTFVQLLKKLQGLTSNSNNRPNTRADRYCLDFEDTEYYRWAACCGGLVHVAPFSPGQAMQSRPDVVAPISTTLASAVAEVDTPPETGACFFSDEAIRVAACAAYNTCELRTSCELDASTRVREAQGGAGWCESDDASRWAATATTSPSEHDTAAEAVQVSQCLQKRLSRIVRWMRRQCNVSWTRTRRSASSVH